MNTKNRNPLHDRRGVFHLDWDLIDRNPEHVLLVMSECVVTRCEMRYDTRSFQYFAMSECFDVVDHLVQCPEYIAKFRTEEIDGEATTFFDGFERVES